MIKPLLRVIDNYYLITKFTKIFINTLHNLYFVICFGLLNYLLTIKRAVKMDTFELKKEQRRLAHKIELKDSFSKIKTLAGIDCIQSGNKLLACIVVCEFPSMKLLEKKTYLLNDPLPYKPGFLAYREMPAMIEAANLLENDPDVFLVSGTGIAHPRRLGLASHLGLSLNRPTIGITEKLLFGRVENGKIVIGNEIVGFEVRTKEHSLPIYLSPGYQITLGSALNIVKESIRYPHKMPEPLHLAHKIGKKRVRSGDDV